MEMTLPGHVKSSCADCGTVGILRVEVFAQLFEDGVVFGFAAAQFCLRCIGSRSKRHLDALFEEVHRIVDHVVGQHVEGCEHLRRLLAQDQLLPQRGVALEPRLRPLHSVVVDEPLGHAAEHQAGHHAHGRGAGAEALARQRLVVVLDALQSDLLQPLASPLLQQG